MINLNAGPRSFVVAAIALLACLLVGLATAAPSHASTGVDVAIDTDVTGNNARGPIGAADNCVAVSPGSRFTVDITAEVPPDDATAGFQFDLLYNSSLLNVVGVDNARMMQAPADQAFDYTDPLPDHDGDLLASYVELDGGTKSGEGMRFFDHLRGGGGWRQRPRAIQPSDRGLIGRPDAGDADSTSCGGYRPGLCAGGSLSPARSFQRHCRRRRRHRRHFLPRRSPRDTWC